MLCGLTKIPDLPLLLQPERDEDIAFSLFPLLFFFLRVLHGLLSKISFAAKKAIPGRIADEGKKKDFYFNSRILMLRKKVLLP